MRKSQNSKESRFLLSFILSSFSVLIASVASLYTGVAVYFLVLVPTLGSLLMGKRIDSFVLLLATALLTILSIYIPFFSPFLFSILMLCIPVYFGLGKHEPLASYLGFNGSIIRATIIAGLSLIPAFVFMIVLSILMGALGLNDAQNVDNTISKLPLYVLIYAATLGPLAEELFFRSFLPKHMHWLFATLLFSVAHYSYGSIFEIVGAFFMGLYLYALFRYTKDIKVPIIAHILINAASLIVMLGLRLPL